MTCLILIGMMGAGKTTVGRELARRLNLRFADCDHELIARTGVSVPIIFEVEGEAGFRQRESRLLAELLAEPDIVIATGGGIVLDPANRALLSEHGTVIYLNTPPHVLWERTRRDRNRPLLQVENPRERIEELFRQRDPLYRAVADIIVDGERGSCISMANRIEKALDEHASGRASCIP
ncbi:MAG: shikimate kinase [Betaproteobacteria bacterium]|nr:shikimate kinase [Betaproteobacteria bacterium]